MTSLEALLAWPLLAPVVGILVIAALTHGTLGFGFPVISTPMIALLTDVQTAVIATLIPNLVVNSISIVRGGEWRHSIAKYWQVPVYVLIGTIVGSQVLLVANPAPIKLLLAAMIVVYLQQRRFRGVDWAWLRRHPHLSGIAFGLLGGFLSGTVNVALPPLLIYFMALGLGAMAMTQILNLCFLVGRSTQAITFGIAGKFGVSIMVATLPLTLISVVALFAGIRLQKSIRPEVFDALLRKVLWAIAAILALQAVWAFR